MQTKVEEKRRENFIEKYVAYASLKTDAPIQYHYSVALTLLAAVCCRNYSADFQHGTLYPNTWVILVGKSSLDRKSTAMKIGKRLLPAYVKKIPEEFSPEALVASLATNASGIMVRDEFAGFLSALRKEYMSGTKDFFCILYDCPDEYTRTLKSNTFNLKNVYFNILSGTTFESLTEHISIEDLKSGFAARFLFGIGEKTGWKGIETRKPEDVATASELKAILGTLYSFFATNKTTAVFSPEVLERYNKWLCELENKRATMDGIDLSPFYTRIGVAVLKIAMLIQLEDELPKFKEFLVKMANGEKPEPTTDITISSKSIETAIMMGEDYLKNMKKVCYVIGPQHKLGKTMKRLEEILKRNDKKVAHSDALRNCNVCAEVFREAVRTLTEREEIETMLDGKKKYYKWIGDEE